MVEDALEADGEGSLGHGKLSIESEGCALGLDIVLEIRSGVRSTGLARLDLDLCGLEGQLQGIEGDLFGGLGDAAIDAVDVGQLGARREEGPRPYVTEPLKVQEVKSKSVRLRS